MFFCSPGVCTVYCVDSECHLCSGFSENRPMGEYLHPFYAHILNLMGRRSLAEPLRRKRESTVELVDVKREKKEEKAALLVMGTFFWILGLIATLFLRYI